MTEPARLDDRRSRGGGVLSSLLLEEAWRPESEQGLPYRVCLPHAGIHQSPSWALSPSQAVLARGVFQPITASNYSLEADDS